MYDNYGPVAMSTGGRGNGSNNAVAWHPTSAAAYSHSRQQCGGIGRGTLPMTRKGGIKERQREGVASLAAASWQRGARRGRCAALP
jgi:hypothetical protein